MNEQDVGDTMARLRLLEAGMMITGTTAYLPYAEPVRTMPGYGPAPGVMELEGSREGIEGDASALVNRRPGAPCHPRR